MTKKKSDLIPRVITALVALPVLIFLIFAAPTWTFGALVAFAAAVSTWEFCNIIYGPQHKIGPWLTGALSIPLVISMYRKTPAGEPFSFDLFFTDQWTIAILSISFLILFLYFLFTYKEQKEASLLVSASVTGLIYGGILISTLGLLHRDAGTAGPLWVLLTLAIVWVSDTGAYFTGRAFGKRKLYKAVSPNKSVEGALGGFIFSVGVAIGLNFAFASLNGNHSFLGFEFALSWTPLSIVNILIVAIPANILGQTGDLAESLIKRAHGVKDSGTIIYGHGGMLDRIDALIFAAPWVYICQRVFFDTVI